MKDSNVNDIFQNDTYSNNKTKTILLLTIVAIILISVFLIIAWVMTRDNSTETITTDNSNTRVTNGNLIPYAHNIDNHQDSDRLGLGDISNTMSNTPSPTLQDNFSNKTSNEVNNKAQESLTFDTHANSLNNEVNNKNSAQHNNDNFENDPKYIAALQQTKEKQVKKEVANNNAKLAHNDTKIEIKPALDPTKSKSTDKKKEESNKESNAKKEDKKITQNNPVQPVLDNPQVKKALNNKPATTTQTPKANENKSLTQKPATTTSTPATPTNQNGANNNTIIPKSTVNKATNNGGVATKGHYIQVGSFEQSRNIDKIFLTKLSQYTYRTKTENQKIKYLVGPYNSKTEATRDLQKIKTELDPGAFYTELTQ